MATDSVGRHGVEFRFGGFPGGGIDDVLSVRRESRRARRAAAIGDLMKLRAGGGMSSRSEKPSGKTGQQYESRGAANRDVRVLRSLTLAADRPPDAVTVVTDSKSNAISRADWKRCSGAFSRQ